MSKDIIYYKIPKLPSTLSKADTCKACKSKLENKSIKKEYVYSSFD